MKFISQTTYECNLCQKIFRSSFDCFQHECIDAESCKYVILNKEVPVFIATGAFLVKINSVEYDEKHNLWLNLDREVAYKDYSFTNKIPAKCLDPLVGHDFCRLCHEKTERAASLAIWKYTIDKYNIKLENSFDLPFISVF